MLAVVIAYEVVRRCGVPPPSSEPCAERSSRSPSPRRWRHERRRRPTAAARRAGRPAPTRPRPGYLIAALVGAGARVAASGSSPAPTRSTPRAPCGPRDRRHLPDPAGRPRRSVDRAGRRGQHRPRGHDDPRHLGRRLLQLLLRRRAAASSAPCSSASLGGLLHALATVTFGVDHIVSGVAINIIALGADARSSPRPDVRRPRPGGRPRSRPAARPACRAAHDHRPRLVRLAAEHRGQALVPGLRPRGVRRAR